MSLDTMNKIVTGLASGTILKIYKASIATLAAGYLISLWRATGEPAQGAIPGAAATCNDDLLGSWPLGDSLTLDFYILRCGIYGATIGTWLVYDRLAHMGGLSGVTTGDQTVGVDLVTASGQGRCNSNGSDVEWFAEIYTAIGVTAQTCTVTYVDQNDVTRTITFSLGGASPLNQPSRCIQLIPNSGQTIKSITKVSISTSTGTAGSWGITARHKLFSLGQMLANIAPPGDFVAIGAPMISDTTCLEICVLCSTTSTGVVQGDMKIGVA
jgi:hypothetical protein